MPEILETLKARGLLQDATANLAERLAEGPVTGYVGFDPTADSLHVGNLVPVMGAAWLQRLGHTPIVLVGGGTAMVGDPSGKRGERPVLPLEQIDRNADALRRQLSRFLAFEGANAARIRNNADWLRRLPLMEFLRDTGKHLTIGYMLQKESVQTRMETGISFTEFTYMLVQAYDFWHLRRTEDCELQFGGSDQWGNITAGIELVKRRDGRQVHGFVLPLITTAAGTKFGKSEAGNVWLDPARTSPYQFFQFWVNTDDRDVERYLKLFTFFSLERIAAVMESHAREPNRRAAQRLLAHDVTARVHGVAAADQVVRTSEALFSGRVTADAILTGELTVEMPERRLSRAALPQGLPVVDLLVASGLASSRADARRGIEGRGFYLNNEPLTSAERRLDDSDLQGPSDRRTVILRKGKKNYLRVILDP